MHLTLKLARPFDLNAVSGKELELSPWVSIDETRTLNCAIGADFELAEEVIGLLEFTDGSFEVGVGESLRPYERLYKGSDVRAASEAFVRAIAERAFVIGGK